MDQLSQKLKDGTMKILEVPSPALQAGHVLVRNHYSLISTGTDTSTVRAARGSLLEKAKARPAQVKQVVDVVRSQGITQAYRAVMKKLDAWSPLGNSTAGEIIGVGEGVSGFAVGDLVACGGLDASHAEIVCVPVNLCVKLHAGADLRHAAYNTLGAIALQGIRQADLRLGEVCAVIGLGLLGQLTCMMLRASGMRVVGIDIGSDLEKLLVNDHERCGLPLGELTELRAAGHRVEQQHPTAGLHDRDHGQKHVAVVAAQQRHRVARLNVSEQIEVIHPEAGRGRGFLAGN